MRIEPSYSGQPVTQATRKTGTNQTNSFDAALRNCMAEDTVTISPQAREAAAAAPSDTVILPTDSDMVKMQKLYEIGQNADYTGMRYGEIYGAIWNRYNEAFDGNMGAILYLGALGGQTWEAIRQQFYRETSHASLCHFYSECDELKKTGSALDRQLAEELGNQFFQDSIGVLGYSNMSRTEIETAIHEKYAGKNTLMNFFNMMGEMEYCGIYQSKLGALGYAELHSEIYRAIGRTYFPDYNDNDGDVLFELPNYDKRIQNILNSNQAIGPLLNNAKKSVQNSKFMGYEFDIQSALESAFDDLLNVVDQRKS